MVETEILWLEGMGRVMEVVICQFSLLLNVQTSSSLHPRGSVLWEKQTGRELCHWLSSSAEIKNE